MAKRIALTMFVMAMMFATALIPLAGEGVATTSDTNMNEDFTYNHLKYTIDTEEPDTVEVSGYDEDIEVDVLIPDTASDEETNKTYTVTSIGDYAFEDCDKLETIYISKTIESIGKRVFKGCINLKEITVDSENGVYKNGEYQPYDNEVLFDKNGTLIKVPAQLSFVFEYETGEGVTSIGDYAFEDCALLEKITISETVTSIGERVFKGCTALRWIEVVSGNDDYETDDWGALFSKDKEKLIQFPALSEHRSYDLRDGVTLIGDYAFQGCNLEEVYITGGTVKSIGDYAFQGCTSLRHISIMGDGTSIGDSAFQDCILLENVYIEFGTKSIGDSAFKNCTSLSEFSIPMSVESIGQGVFQGCTSLASINVDDWNSNYTSDKYGVLFDKDKKELIQYPIGNSRNSYTIPESVTSIDTDAFNGCTSLKEITIPGSVKTIGDTAFNNCTSLESISVGACKLEMVGDNVLTGCQLKFIRIDKEARGFSKLFEGYKFYDKDGNALTTEDAIAGHKFEVNGEGGMTALIGHTITYDVDGGSGPAPTQEPLFKGDTFLVAGYSGTKDGYTFKGWSDGTNTYRAGDTYTMGDKDVTLTAVWKESPSPGGDDNGLPVWAIALIAIVAIAAVAGVAYYFLLHKEGKGISDLIGKKEEAQPPQPQVEEPQEQKQEQQPPSQ